MTRTLLVTLGETLPTPAPFNEKNIPAPKTHKEMAIFFNDNRDEIAIAESILEHAPVGTKLRSHHRNRKLLYKDLTTGQSFTLGHTYVKTCGGITALGHTHVKTDGGITVQIERGDINLVGSGSFGTVKRMYTVNNNRNAHQPPIIVIKKCVNEQSALRDLDTELTSIFISAEKPNNPFKSAIGETGVVERPLWSQSTISVQFDATEFNKEQPSRKSANTDLSKTRSTIKKSNRQPLLEFSPYLPMTLHQFIKRGITSDDTALHLIFSSLKTMEKASNLGIVHRDLKPDNILVNPASKSAQVIDWGGALRIPPGHDHVVSTYMGTIAYLPYELAFNVFQFAEQGVVSKKTFDTLFPFFNHSKAEVPQDTIRKGPGRYHYRSDYDTYALGLCIRQIATLATPDTANTIKSLATLMTCYHPDGRPSLTLMRLSFFSVLWDEKQTSHGLTKTDPATFRDALAKEGLPILSIEMIRAIKDILVLTSEIFQIAQTRSSAAPKHHEKNQWELLFKINTKLEALIHDQADVTAFMSLRGMLVSCRENCSSELQTIIYCINSIQFFESRLFYQPLLPALNTASSDERKYFLIALSISSRIFQDHPDEQALSLHTLDLFKKVSSPTAIWQLQQRILKGQLITLFHDLITQHWKEKTASTTQQDTHTLSSPRFFQATSHEAKMPFGFSAEIDAALQSPVTTIEDKVAILQAIHARIKVTTITTPQVTI